jgi:hypothetical protein
MGGRFGSPQGQGLTPLLEVYEPDPTTTVVRSNNCLELFPECYAGLDCNNVITAQGVTKKCHVFATYVALNLASIVLRFDFHPYYIHSQSQT